MFVCVEQWELITEQNFITDPAGNMRSRSTHTDESGSIGTLEGQRCVGEPSKLHLG